MTDDFIGKSGTSIVEHGHMDIMATLLQPDREVGRRALGSARAEPIYQQADFHG